MCSTRAVPCSATKAARSGFLRCSQLEVLSVRANVLLVSASVGIHTQGAHAQARRSRTASPNTGKGQIVNSASNLDPWRNRYNALQSNDVREKEGVTVGRRSNTPEINNSASASTIWRTIGVGSKLDADLQPAMR